MHKNSLLLFGTSSGLQRSAKDSSEPAHYKKGLTLIELLIVVAILMVMLLLGWFSWRNQINKARDAQRKEHLERLSIAFEEWYNDNECYPTSGIVDICQGPELQPYLQSIPCDPIYETPYCYVHDPDNLDCGQSFKLLAPLANSGDPIITKLLCHGDESCGYDATCEADTGYSGNFNYGTGSGNVPILNPAVSPPPVPSPGASVEPSPSPSGDGIAPGYEGDLACDPSGICNNYDDPEAAGCPITFYQAGVCQSYCDESSDWWCSW